MSRILRTTRCPLLPAAVFVLGGVLSCGGASRDAVAMRSPNPLDRAVAAVRAADSGGAQAAAALVDLLEDPDPAVRMYAILALRRLTGEDHGYRYYASVEERVPAVARWREALRQGRVTVQPQLAAQTTGDAAPPADPSEVTP